jgi:hypothetical protein
VESSRLKALWVESIVCCNRHSMQTVLVWWHSLRCFLGSVKASEVESGKLNIAPLGDRECQNPRRSVRLSQLSKIGRRGSATGTRVQRRAGRSEEEAIAAKNRSIHAQVW